MTVPVYPTGYVEDPIDDITLLVIVKTIPKSCRSSLQNLECRRIVNDPVEVVSAKS